GLHRARGDEGTVVAVGGSLRARRRWLLPADRPEGLRWQELVRRDEQAPRGTAAADRERTAGARGDHHEVPREASRGPASVGKRARRRARGAPEVYRLGSRRGAQVVEQVPREARRDSEHG